jgi:hypothetical protein
VSERKIYTISITDEDGHEHVEARLDSSHEPTPEILALMLVRASMSLDPSAVQTAALSGYVARRRG